MNGPNCFNKGDDENKEKRGREWPIFLKKVMKMNKIFFYVFSFVEKLRLTNVDKSLLSSSSSFDVSRERRGLLTLQFRKQPSDRLDGDQLDEDHRQTEGRDQRITWNGEVRRVWKIFSLLCKVFCCT